MILTLEITGSHAEKLGTARRKVFKASGGSIGRSPGNYWVLPDPTLHISSRHALIRYVDGAFYIEDTNSTNGVCVNSPDAPLAKGQAYALTSGDRIFIEPYEIRVSITSLPKTEMASPDDPFAPFAPPAPGPFMRTSDVVPLPVHDDELDPMKKLGFEPKSSRPDVPKLDGLRGKSVLHDHIEPPRPIDPPSQQPSAEKVPFIPPYNPLDDSGEVPVPPPPKAQGDSRAPGPQRRAPVVKPPERSSPPVVPPSPKQESKVPVPVPGAGDLHGVLLGAGLESVDVTPELARDFGEILRAVVGGLMDVLQARKRLKSEFRMEMTAYRQTANNPLKYSVNVDDALHNLLVKRNAAFLGPVEAFEDAFEDVRNHEMAMLAGMRMAFDAMLAEFDPDRLQADFDRQSKKGALISVPAKLRYWELYREKFHGMVKDPERCFRELFGDEFAAAYEEQLKRLKGQGRASKR